MSLRKSQKEATRQRVLDAARELFEAKGFEAATVRDIARMAGVSVGSVFTTFASKGDILSQVMADRLANEYQLDVIFEPAPYAEARWVTGAKSDVEDFAGKHEALADIYESIEEMKYYREHFIRL